LGTQRNLCGNQRLAGIAFVHFAWFGGFGAPLPPRNSADSQCRVAEASLSLSRSVLQNLSPPAEEQKARLRTPPAPVGTETWA